MSLDLLSIASLVGSPVAYVVIGFSLYKVYNRIVQAERYARRANHNSDLMVKALIREGFLTEQEVRDVQLGDDQGDP